MDVLDAINRMLDESGTSRAELANAVGRTKQALTNMFYKKTDVQTNTLTKMANAMGYELALIPKGEASKVDGSLVITTRKEDEQ